MSMPFFNGEILIVSTHLDDTTISISGVILFLWVYPVTGKFRGDNQYGGTS